MEAAEPKKLMSYYLNLKLRAFQKLTKMKLKTTKKSKMLSLKS